MSVEKLNKILEERFRGDPRAMAAFLGIPVEELEGMLDGTLPTPEWIWERLEPRPPAPPPIPRHTPGFP
jgi:hypothetical protein